MVWYFYGINGTVSKNVIFFFFGVNMNSSVYIDKKEKDILILGKGPTEGLHNTKLTAEVQYSINVSGLKRKFYLSLHYNGTSSFLLVNAVLTVFYINIKQNILK